jgi:hypothetical protein
MTYRDPVIAAYIALLKEKAGGSIKEFYQGDPIRIPTTNYPCVMVSKRQTRVGPVSNAEDGHEIGLTITVIADVRNDLTTDSGAQSAVAGVATLYDIIEGRDADMTLKDTSILGILRSNLIVDATCDLRTDLGSITTADYGATQRGRSPESWSIEGRVDIVSTFHQVR